MSASMSHSTPSSTGQGNGGGPPSSTDGVRGTEERMLKAGDLGKAWRRPREKAEETEVGKPRPGCQKRGFERSGLGFPSWGLPPRDLPTRKHAAPPAGHTEDRARAHTLGFLRSPSLAAD